MGGWVNVIPVILQKSTSSITSAFVIPVVGGPSITVLHFVILFVILFSTSLYKSEKIKKSITNSITL